MENWKKNVCIYMLFMAILFNFNCNDLLNHIVCNEPNDSVYSGSWADNIFKYLLVFAVYLYHVSYSIIIVPN